MNYDQERDIIIHGLTTEQRKMLDKIWSIDEPDDFEDFVGSLPRFRQQQVATLCLLINYEFMEFELDDMTTYTDADALLSKIKQKYKN